jgi:hypothetical protein
VPSDKTFVTEVATALGMLGGALDVLVAARPSVLANVTVEQWDHLDELWRTRQHHAEFLAGHRNGQAFLEAIDGLRGRTPRLIEWTGARRPVGDESVPSDLRVDHVYLVSCKYVSKVLQNPGPARLFDALLTSAPLAERGDWYQRVAPEEHQAFYEAYVGPVADRFPARVEDLDKQQRKAVAHEYGRRDQLTRDAAAAYARLCTSVSIATADHWNARLEGESREQLLWRLLRIGAAPYFILGADGRRAIRLRIDTPWDWRQRYRFVGLTIEPQFGGQPLVGWSAQYEVKETGELLAVTGHVEVRWSHGRFAQPPEAKVYLDTPHHQVPGYHEL